MEVLVVGAGLAGLTTARELAAAGRDVHVVEARPRVGGRMHTVSQESPTGEAWFDVGATWHWTDQPRIRALAAEFGLRTFPQFDEGRVLHEPAEGGPPTPVEVPANAAGYLRFVGGAQPLAQRLADALPPGTVSLGVRVSEVAEDGERLVVITEDEDGETVTLSASLVVVTVPPRLVLETISFTPALPDDLVQVIEATPTWMGEAVKCVAVYDTPFWREAELSGSALSDSGPLSEVHDACTHDGSGAALWGFLEFDADYRAMDVPERAPLVLDQLERLFGPPAGDPAQYFERDWSADPYTAEDEHRHVASLEYGHPRFSEAVLGGRLLWAGAETAREGGGHMEGAVVSGQRAAQLVLQSGLIEA